MRRARLPPFLSKHFSKFRTITVSLLDDMDPLATSKSRAALKTPQSFLGENSGLVNLDQLIQAPAPTAQPAAYNPFGDIQQPSKTNLFQQQMQPVSSRR